MSYVRRGIKLKFRGLLYAKAVNHKEGVKHCGKRWWLFRESHRRYNILQKHDWFDCPHFNLPNAENLG
jgi:hypothetical protein